jgi:hypothetical protein
LREIERLAGRMFAGMGMRVVAEYEPASVGELRTCAAEGRAFVADDPDRPGFPAGYLLVEEVDTSPRCLSVVASGESTL